MDFGANGENDMDVSMQNYFRQLLWGLVFGSGWGCAFILFGVGGMKEASKNKLAKIKDKISQFFNLKSNQFFFSSDRGNQKIRSCIDFAFCMISGVALAIFSYATSDGVLRWFSLVAIVAGAFLTIKCVAYPVEICIYLLLCLANCGTALLAIIVRKFVKIVANILIYVLPLKKKIVLIFHARCVKMRHIRANRKPTKGMLPPAETLK